MEQVETLLTVGEITRRLDERIHRIEYVIRSRQIPTVGCAGHARVFSPASLERIASELRRMEADRVIHHGSLSVPSTCSIQKHFFKLQFLYKRTRLSPEFPIPNVVSTPKAPHSPVLSTVSRSQIGCRFAFSNQELTHWVEEALVSSLQIRSAVRCRNTSN